MIYRWWTLAGLTPHPGHWAARYSEAIVSFIGVSVMLSSTDSSLARSCQHTSLQKWILRTALNSTYKSRTAFTVRIKVRPTLPRIYGASVDLSTTPAGSYMHRRTALGPDPAYLVRLWHRLNAGGGVPYDRAKQALRRAATRF
jgi:hypothetical protein